MLKLCRVTKVKVLFLVLVDAFNFHLFEFSAAILEKGLLVNAGVLYSELTTPILKTRLHEQFLCGNLCGNFYLPV